MNKLHTIQENKMQRKFESLDIDGEVISVEPSSKFITAYPMFKTEQFKVDIKRLCQNYSGISTKISEQWFSEGINCEVLKLNSNAWQKGKIRIKLTLEFCPDETEVAETTQSKETENNQPESPLDDIRRMMHKDN